MRLLHTQIDVVPGRKPQMPPPTETIGPGSALLQITNTTEQENAYIVRISCQTPGWQDDWYVLRALPPANEAQRGGKPDQYGPGNRTVKLFVSRGATRDVQILFQLPQEPDSLAGRYAVTVSVETQLMAATPGAPRNRFTELPCTVTVRPYYQWSLDVEPAEPPRVGWLRPATEVQLVIANQGNDWLYCDLQIPQNKDLLLASDTLRVAVPPPAIGSERSLRAVPVRAVTKLRTVRGPRTPQTLGIQAIRVDAPSVAPLTDEYGQPTYSSGEVLAAMTAEARPIPQDRAVVYCPPVPATLTDFFSSVSNNLRTIITTVIGLIVALNLGVLMWEHQFRSNIEARLLTQQVPGGGWVTLQGNYLPGSRIQVSPKSTTPSATDDFEDVKDVRVGRPDPKSPPPAGDAQPKWLPDPRYVSFRADSRFNGQALKVRVQRLGFLPYLSPLLPRSLAEGTVQVGAPPPVERKPPTFSVGGDFERGRPFTIQVTGTPLSAGPAGTVLLGGSVAKVVGWSPRKIVAVVPADAPSGPLPVIVQMPDGTPYDSGKTITIIDTPSPSPSVAIASSPSVAPSPVVVPSPTAAPTPVASSKPTPTAAPTPTPAPVSTPAPPPTAPPTAPPPRRPRPFPSLKVRVPQVPITPLRLTPSGKPMLPPAYERLLLHDYKSASDMTASDRDSNTAPLNAAIWANANLVIGDPRDALAAANDVLRATSAPKLPEQARARALALLVTIQGQADPTALDQAIAEARALAPDCILVYTLGARRLNDTGRHADALALLRSERPAVGDTRAAPAAVAWGYYDIGETSHSQSVLRSMLRNRALLNEPKLQELMGLIRQANPH